MESTHGRYKEKKEMTSEGKEISKRLIDLGMTQRELADEIGTTPQYIQKILRGERSGAKYLEAISDVLDIQFI